MIRFMPPSRLGHPQGGRPSAVRVGAAVCRGVSWRSCRGSRSTVEQACQGSLRHKEPAADFNGWQLAAFYGLIGGVPGNSEDLSGFLDLEGLAFSWHWSFLSLGV